MTAETERKRLTVDQQGTILSAHYGLVCDALEHFYYKVSERRPEVEKLFRELQEWHDHDQEDEHCTSDCPAWFVGSYCTSCGIRHFRLRVSQDRTEEAAETVHLCPPDYAPTMPCCDRTPFEVSPHDRMTLDPEKVTCRV